MPSSRPNDVAPRTDAPFSRRLAQLARWYWLAPLFAIVLFIAVMLAVFYALRQDEIDRQQQGLYREIEASRQALRARLQVNQDEMIVLAHDFDPSADDEKNFGAAARAILRAHPALISIAWIDTQRVWRRVTVSDVQFDGGPREEGDVLENAVSRVAFEAARDRHAPTYSQPYVAGDGDMYIELHVPLYDERAFEGTVVAVTSLASLARHAIPKEATERSDVLLVDSGGHTLAGVPATGRLQDRKLGASSVSLAVGPPLSDMYLRANSYRTRSALADNFLVWAVAALSALIVWTLWSQTKHQRRRREAEAARDRIFNLSLDILAVLDHRGRIARVNPACARILGREPEQLEGISLLDLVHPDDRAASAVELTRISEGGVISAFENRCRRFNPDGSIEYRWLVWNFNPDLATRGDKRLLYAVAHDVTQRRARQQALQAETAFRRAMEDSMLTGMRVLDMSGRITYVNPAFCRMLGYTEHDLLGATAPFPYWPRDRHAEVRSSFEDIMAGRVPPSGLEVRVQTRDGGFLDTRMYVSPLIDANGVQTGWMTSMTDITQSKRARQELAAAQERFTTVLDELDVAVSVCALDAQPDAMDADRDGGAAHGRWPLLFANRHYRQCFGTEADGHRELNAARSRMDVASGTEAEADAFAREVFSVRAQRWFEVRTRTIQWVDGSPVRMQVATDITARVSTRERERQQEEKVQLTSRLIAMGEMASSLAHELNQPLTAIANYSMGTVARVRRSIATGGATDPEELLGMLQKTAAQAQRAGNIIRRIREFVKRSEPRKQRCRIRAIVDDAVGLAELDAAKRRIAIVVEVPAGIEDIDADAILVEQVLLNLIRNACEAMSDELAAGVARAVTVSVRDVGPDDADAHGASRFGHVEFAIVDRGTGIAEGIADKLFEPFYSTKAEGMGMGLNICRSIVEFHHGRLWAERNPHGGTIFRFTVPRSNEPGVALRLEDAA